MSKTFRFTSAVDAFIARDTGREFVSTHKLAGLNSALRAAAPAKTLKPIGWTSRTNDAPVTDFGALGGAGADWSVPAYNDVAEITAVVNTEIARDLRDLKIDGREG